MHTKGASSLRRFELLLPLVLFLGPLKLTGKYMRRLPVLLKCYMKREVFGARSGPSPYIRRNSIRSLVGGFELYLKDGNVVQNKLTCQIVVEYLNNRRTPSSSKCDSSILLAKAEYSVL